MKGILFLVITVFLNSAFGEMVNANNIDWSQVSNAHAPTGTKKGNSFSPSLPSCSDLEQQHAQGLPGVKVHYNTPCIGTLSSPGETQITLSDALIEKLEESETISDLKKLADKYPVIKAVAVVAALCRPTGSFLNPDGAYCRYSGKF